MTLYSLLLSLLRSQKHFNTMYDMTKPKHIITVASELKKLSRAVTMPPVCTVTNIHSAKSASVSEVMREEDYIGSHF